MGRLYEPYLEAVLAGDGRRAFAVVDGALAEGLGVRELYLEVFQPALHEVGRLWQEGLATVAEEHLATAITQAAMARVYDRLIADRATGSGPKLLAAGTDPERHDIGLRMLCDLLEERGWSTTYLGGTVDRRGLLEMVLAKRPDVLALTVTVVQHLSEAEGMIHDIREACGRKAPLVMVGGRVFVEEPERVARVDADLRAKDAGEAVDLLTARFG